MKSWISFNLLFTLTFVTTLSAEAVDRTVYGPDVPVGKGIARSFVTLDDDVPEEIGFWLSATALEELPEHDSIYEIALPAGVDVKPYNHLTLDWNVHGHIPNGIYNVPHFDFHFYLISPQEREQILCDVADNKCMKTPTPEKIPANYIGAPEGHPKMGWHWVDLSSPEFHGSPFTATFVYGYYDGEINFIEPMVALSYLTKSVNFEKDIPLPQKFALKGYYPKEYSVTYKAPVDAYLITLEDLTWKE